MRLRNLEEIETRAPIKQNESTGNAKLNCLTISYIDLNL